MAVCIVELLEKIDVHHHGGDGRHFVPSVVQRQTFQRTAVFHPRQFVRVRHLIQLDIHTANVGVLLLDDDLGVTGRDLTAVKPKRDEKSAQCDEATVDRIAVKIIRSGRRIGQQQV